MRCARIFVAFLLLYVIASLSASAQFPPAKDSLTPAQSGPSAAACSATDASSCAQAAAKIVPLVMGPSPMEENLRRLTDEIGGRMSGSPEMAKAVEWAVAAFRAEGVEVHTEKYTLPATWSEGETRLAIMDLHGRGIISFRPTNDIIATGMESKSLRAVSEGWSPPAPALRGESFTRVVDVG
jgi:hypothetical protein